jgi:hypothetical protein
MATVFGGRNSVRMTTLWLSVVLLTATAAPQQSVSPPESASSLEATMQLIQDGMLGQHTHAGEYTSVQANAATCTLSWTAVDTYSKKPPFTQHTEQKLSFSDIANVSVAYDELAANWNLELYAAAGKKFDVHSYFLKNDVSPCERCKKNGEERTERPRWFIYFTSEETARREANAILRAAELCRASEKPPLRDIRSPSVGLELTKPLLLPLASPLSLYLILRCHLERSERSQQRPNIPHGPRGIPVSHAN